MKKTLAVLATLCLGFSVANAEDIYGTIIDINDASKTILVETSYGQKINMKILPHTQIDMDECGIFWTDKQGTFKDLKVGTFLEAEVFYTNTQDPQAAPQMVTVKKIDIECKKELTNLNQISL
ncbi:hypothetical protein KJQ83_05565 [Campylobacter upsaliensis]|uniref:hypothetical protein n=1 Tax=Campylobacter upsaliensis TaxID=28080 RepID=UPI0013A1C9A5|nr:hypothetical protein [Campylobacter upsaliensis]ECV9715225.1 hypothetical protein [Campylobacter upsaliensis]MBT0756674.1 hypothetical protein [Campylobacter upsaliensis]